MRRLIENLEDLMEMGIGDDVETPAIRAHRYASAIRVTELVNAGKRGKKVRQFALYDLDYKMDPDFASRLEKFAATVDNEKSYDRALKRAESLVNLAREMHQHGVNIEQSTLRGVDVAPAGTLKLDFIGKGFSFRLDNNGFSIRSLTDPNEETLMAPIRRKKTNIAKFRKWAAANEKKIPTMTFQQIKSALDKNKIEYHSYLGMD